MNKDLGIVSGAVGHVVHFARDCVVLRPDPGLETAIHQVAYETDDYSLHKGDAVFPDVKA